MARVTDATSGCRQLLSMLCGCGRKTSCERQTHTNGLGTGTKRQHRGDDEGMDEQAAMSKEPCSMAQSQALERVHSGVAACCYLSSVPARWRRQRPAFCLSGDVLAREDGSRQKGRQSRVATWREGLRSCDHRPRRTLSP
ncbi:hypothetical protein BDV95DRAFT_596250 [Massariosphaeria phaeospora]|uniref:Uncharacterized protein n=1 Tax=Massariosphaeria phaeospora TaxID=100035 RepID=A0A7C8IBH4_9PLEO|nr:hypothetical protein BDV95DRAFT_596250 [Massariosphaeria phaeospora]